MKQVTFAGLAFDAKKKTTKREKFLAEMDRWCLGRGCRP